MTSIPPFIDKAWLDRHGREVVVADVRWYLDGRSGLDAYRSGHLPGAVFVDLNQWLADPPAPGRGRHPLPVPDRFAEGMSRSGIGDTDTVVVPWPADRLVGMKEVDPVSQVVLDARPAEALRQRFVTAGVTGRCSGGVLLRLGGGRLPQPARHGVARSGLRPALRRFLVAVEQRPNPPDGHRPGLTHPSGVRPSGGTRLSWGQAERRAVSGRCRRRRCGDRPR